LREAHRRRPWHWRCTNGRPGWNVWRLLVCLWKKWARQRREERGQDSGGRRVLLRCCALARVGPPIAIAISLPLSLSLPPSFLPPIASPAHALHLPFVRLKCCFLLGGPFRNRGWRTESCRRSRRGGDVEFGASSRGLHLVGYS
jgi:hypothetical protein